MTDLFPILRLNPILFSDTASCLKKEKKLLKLFTAGAQQEGGGGGRGEGKGLPCPFLKIKKSALILEKSS